MRLTDAQFTNFQAFLAEVYEGNYQHILEFRDLATLAGDAGNRVSGLIVEWRAQAEIVIQEMGPAEDLDQKHSARDNEQRKYLGDAHTFLGLTEPRDEKGYLKAIDHYDKGIALDHGGA